jgi:hypothetical protein
MGMRKIALSLFSLVLSAALLSWGATGHRTIGKIAAGHLTPQATAAVRELIGDTTLAEISTWPDEVRSQPAYRSTAPWHYINLPIGLSFADFEAKVKGMNQENVYSALLKQEQILGSATSTRPQKVEAMKYIVHFVGDLHQPMHVSREEDKGGNTIQLNYDGNGTNLHALWDSKLIDHQGLTYEQMAEKYDHATPAQIKQWQNEPLIQWIWESYQASSKLYAEVDAMKSRAIDDSYYQAHIAIVEDRIEKAGIRLAGVLNEVFASAPKTIAVQDAAQHYNESVNICVTGTVVSYRDKPEIVVTDPKMIVVSGQ